MENRSQTRRPFVTVFALSALTLGASSAGCVAKLSEPGTLARNEPPKATDAGGTPGPSQSQAGTTGPTDMPDAGRPTVAGAPADAGRPTADAKVDEPARHMVTACPAGNQSEMAGTWVNITPPTINLDPQHNGFNTGVNAFVIDPSNTATLYLGTCSQGIWKTTDCGATWVHINTGALGKDLDIGRNWTMAIDPVDPRILYANSGYGAVGLFKSINGGVDWKQLFPEDSEFARTVDRTFVEFIAMNPSDHLHLVVSTHAECFGNVAGPTCFAESFDGGDTWRMAKADPRMGYEAVGHVVLNRDTWIGFAPHGGIFLTTDRGATWSNPLGGYASNQQGELYKAADGAYYAPSLGGVMRSADGLSWSHIPNTPRSFSMAGDGQNTFVSVQDDNPEPAYWSTRGDFSKWEGYPSPRIPRGSWLMRYDRDHNLLYSSNETGGFWRAKIK
jgi:photosystem II stability/assembly factor-like uncharacterized protein